MRCSSLHLPLTCYCVSTHQNRRTRWGREEPVSWASLQKKPLFISHTARRASFSHLIFLNIFPSSSHTLCFKHTAMFLTGSRSLADKGNELLLYFLHSIQIIHKEDVPITGFAGNIHKLSIVCIRKANSKYNVAWKWNSHDQKLLKAVSKNNLYYLKIEWHSQYLSHHDLSTDPLTYWLLFFYVIEGLV